MTKRLNLFLVGGDAWSGVVEWSDNEERERLREVVDEGYWDAGERWFVPARSIISASLTVDDDSEVSDH